MPKFDRLLDRHFILLRTPHFAGEKKGLRTKPISRWGSQPPVASSPSLHAFESSQMFSR